MSKVETPALIRFMEGVSTGWRVNAAPMRVVKSYKAAETYPWGVVANSGYAASVDIGSLDGHEAFERGRSVGQEIAHAMTSTHPRAVYQEREQLTVTITGHGSLSVLLCWRGALVITPEGYDLP